MGGYPGSGGSGYPGGGYPGGGSPDPGHYWKVSYANSNVVDSHDQRDTPVVGQSVPTQVYGGSTIINGDNEATVTTTLTWVPAAGQSLQTDPPSEPVHLKEHGEADYGSSWGGPGSEPGASGTADDGLGDGVRVGNLHWESEGTHLLHRDGSSGTITLDAVTLKAINPASTWHSGGGGYPGAGYPGGGSGYPGGGSGYPGGGYSYWDWTGGYNAIRFSVAVVDDNRAVSISSPIEDSYYKGYPQGSYSNRWNHQRTASGGLTVDSVVAWQNASGGSLGVSGKNKGWQVTGLPLTATPVDFLSSEPTYSWSLNGLPEGSLTHTSDNPTFFSLYEADGSKLPLYGTVNVTATDSDGATASNFYNIKWHLPVEPHDLFSSVKNPKEKMDGPLSPDPCYPGLPPLQNRASPEGDINIAAGIDSVALILGASGQEGAAGLVEIMAKLAETVELKHHYGGEPAKPYTNNQDLWNTCVQTPAQAEHNADASLLTMTDNNGRLNGFEFTTMKIWIVKYTLHKIWRADFYDAHGFNHDGTVYADPIDDPNGIKPEPYYTTQNAH